MKHILAPQLRTYLCHVAVVWHYVYKPKLRVLHLDKKLKSWLLLKLWRHSEDLT